MRSLGRFVVLLSLSFPTCASSGREGFVRVFGTQAEYGTPSQLMATGGA